MPKNNLLSTATAVLTKDELTNLRPYSVTAQIAAPDFANVEAFQAHYRNVIQLVTELTQRITVLEARCNKFIVNPTTGAVTYPI